VSVVDHCKFSIGAWVELLHALGMFSIVVLVTIRQGHCVWDGRGCPLDLVSCCVREVVSIF
jgi:hypothetical protein